MTRERANAIAASLDVGLHSPGLCLACLTFVAFEDGDGRAVAGQVRTIAPTLWAEGFDKPVRSALLRAVREGVPRADEALQDLDDRGFRSAIFRAVVLRLGGELREDARKRAAAPWN